MDLNEYQQKARKTALYPDQGKIGGLVYTVLGLSGEAGELANKVKKVIRDDEGILTEKKRQELIGELSDVLWYLSGISEELKTDLNHIADINLRKLFKRLEEGKIKGSGDNR